MDLYKQFKTDERKEVEGVWIPLSTTARIKVARMGNPRYRDCIKRKKAAYRQTGIEIPSDVLEQMVRETVAETILVDWEGITTDGQPVPYSKETALTFCTDLQEFYNLVLSASDTMETFRAEAQATIEKN